MASQPPLAGRRPRHALVAALLAVMTALAAGCDEGVPPSPPPAATATFAEPTPAPTAAGTPVGEGLLEEIPNLTPLPPLTAVPMAAIGAEERLAVYRTVVLLLASAERVPVVYLNPYLGEGERLDMPLVDSPLPDALIPALREAAPGRTFETAEFIDVVGPLEEGGVVKGGGAYITLGPVEDSADFEGGVRVRASLFHEVDNAGGYTYDLRREPSEPGGWLVVRTTQDWLDRVR
ncbi:MAG TPA: hypothetical protein VFR15_17075 [Chloroflexia bacterium]|nr:hypothetical protein [Chloroflexia bacterium]